MTFYESFFNIIVGIVIIEAGRFLIRPLSEKTYVFYAGVLAGGILGMWYMWRYL